MGYFDDVEPSKESFSEKEPVKAGYFSDLKEEPSRIRSLLSATPKGIVKGLNSLSKILPVAKPIPEELGLKLTEEFLPTQDKFAENVLERGGSLLPTTAFGGGGIASAAIKSLIGGVAGESTKELGGGDIAQSLAEMIGLSFPSLSKQIVSSKSQKPLIDFARKMGMTEKEISPLIQGENKQSLIAKLGSGKKIKEALSKSRQATGKIYKAISESPEALKPLDTKSTSELMQGLKKELIDLPAGVRKIAMRDLMDLFKGNSVNGKDLMNVYQDLNYYVGKGNKLIGKLKGPISEAIDKLSPEFAEDFKMTNKLWENSAKFGKKLKPNLLYDIKSLGKLGSIASAVFMGNYKPLAAYAGLAVAEPALAKLATNPRLQNLSQQVIKSLNESKFSQAKKIGEILEKEFEKKLIDQLHQHEHEE